MGNVDALTCANLKHATRSCDLSTTCPHFTAELSLENGFRSKKGGKKLIGLLTRFHPSGEVHKLMTPASINQECTPAEQLFVGQHKQSSETAHMVIFKTSDVRQSRY